MKLKRLQRTVCAALALVALCSVGGCNGDATLGWMLMPIGIVHEVHQMVLPKSQKDLRLHVPADPYERSESDWEWIHTRRARWIREYREAADKETRVAARNGLSLFPAKHHFEPLSRTSPNGQYTAAEDRETVVVTEKTTGRTWTFGKEEFCGYFGIIYFAFDSSSRYLIFGSKDSSDFRLWDTQSQTGGRPGEFEFPTLGLDICAIEFIPGTTRLVCGDSMGKVWITGMHGVKGYGGSGHVKQGALRCPIWALAIRPDRGCFVSGHGNGELVEWDLSSQKEKSTYDTQLGEILELNYSADGKSVIFTVAGEEQGEKKSYRWVPGEKTHTES